MASHPSPPALRLWPAFVIVGLQWFSRYGLAYFNPDLINFGVLGGVAAGALLAVWWLFFSRATRLERFSAIPLLILFMMLTTQLLHESVATGMMGMMFVVVSIPVTSLVFLVWATLMRNAAANLRFGAMVATLAAACLGWTLVRTGGIDAGANAFFHWRWSPTAEQQFIAQLDDDRQEIAQLDHQAAAPAWSGFRGNQGDSAVSGTTFETDWQNHPPRERWRRPVGPAWSSFAVSQGYFFTQEQRDQEEMVTCYRLADGEPVWQHADQTRFWESNAGAGPRATPTLADDMLYTLGATGRFNALKARDGTVVWSRDITADSGVEAPGWGFSCSPLVHNQRVYVAAAGTLLAYDRANGEPVWQAEKDNQGYSSPVWCTLDGVEQILLVSGYGLRGYDPADGKTLWSFELPGLGIVLPKILNERELLVSAGSSQPLFRLEISRDGDDWQVKQLWESRGLKVYFNAVVTHGEQVFGFDGRIMAAVNLNDGKRAWKGGRYGQGQCLLLPDQDLLLVLSESGDLALVGADGTKFQEFAKIPALQGKTWNHPVLIDNLLLLRNAEEMAMFELSQKPSKSAEASP